MKVLTNLSGLTLVGCFSLGLAGCASTQAPQELVDARAAYTRAEGGRAAQFKPEQVHEAKRSLDAAERAFVEAPDDQVTKDLAYVAGRKALLADANAANAQAVAMRAQAEEDAKAATTGQLTAARQRLVETDQQLSVAGQALAGTQQQLASEKEARAAADKRAKDAMDRLAAASVASVKEEPRGTVITLSGSVLFASGKDTLLPASQERLTQVAEVLQNQADHKIVVEGHTDSQGSEASNQALSERRATAVMSFLTSRGVAAEQISAVGVGQGRPVADNTSPEGRANNRRVEIIVRPIEAR